MKTQIKMKINNNKVLKRLKLWKKYPKIRTTWYLKNGWNVIGAANFLYGVFFYNEEIYNILFSTD